MPLLHLLSVNVQRPSFVFVTINESTIFCKRIGVWCLVLTFLHSIVLQSLNLVQYTL